MSKVCLRAIVAVAVLSVSAQFANAAFHLMQIEQVIGGVNGDTTAQAVQLRMRSAGQNVLGSARIRAFDATGSNPIVVVNFNANVANSAAGSRVLVASANFPLETLPAAVDDVAVAVNLIPESYLCAGSLTFEDDGGTIYWRVSWGGSGYTGSTTGSTTNDIDGQFGPAFAGPLPSDSSRALRFQGAFSALSVANSTDYAVTALAPTFTNNAGTGFVVQNCAVNGDCNDGVPCTTDTCSAGACAFTANNAICDDNAFCTGTETCAVGAGACSAACTSSGNPCGGATPFCVESTDTCAACLVAGDCDDGVACTDDACNAGTCTNTPNNSLCPDDGVFCNGAEICNAVTGCVSGGNPCNPPENCDEGNAACAPAMSSLGMAVMALLTVTIGFTRLRKRTA